MRVTLICFNIILLFSAQLLTAQAPFLNYSTSIDISTASFSGTTFPVTAQEPIPNGITFNIDGTKMYIIGIQGDAVFEYGLGTPFDISTASFTTGFSVSAQELNPRGITFNNDGTKMYITGNSSDNVHEYALSTAFDVSSASFATNFSVAVQDTNPRGVSFNNDGTRMFLAGNNSQAVHEYALSAAFDVSTASITSSFSVSAQQTTFEALDFNKDGTKMFTMGGADMVFEYILSTAFDITTADFVIGFSIATEEMLPGGLAFSADGTQMYMVGEVGVEVYVYDLRSFGFTEAVANDGSVAGTFITTIGHDTFTNAGGTLTSPTHFTINNLPPGLTPSMSVSADGRKATLSLTGNAINHEDIDDVTNLQFTFTDAAFTISTASAVINATGPASSNVGIDFTNSIPICASPPTANAGADIIITEGFSTSLVGLIGGGATSSTWTSTGDGAFDDATGLSATYMPGGSDIVAGTALLTLTTDDPDGTGPCVAATDQLTLIINPNSPPALGGTGFNLIYTENDAPAPTDNGMTVTDIDNANLVSARVSITTNFVAGEDVLDFTDQNGITGSFDAATGVLSLTGTTSLANYQIALRSVTYENTSEDPNAADRGISSTANDGLSNSNAVTRIVQIVPVNDLPEVTTTVATLTYTFGGGPVVIDPGVTVTDIDNITLESASIGISVSYVPGEDVLGFSNQNGIIGIFDDVNGIMDLSGAATMANYQQALRSVTYENTSIEPSTTMRTIGFQVNDGTDVSLVASTQNEIILDVLPGELIVYNALSPNGDAKHDFFEIANIQRFPNNKVIIFNRWGDRVFETNNYDNQVNVFTGRSDSGNELPDGTYFYRIDLGDSAGIINGFLVLKN